MKLVVPCPAKVNLSLWVNGKRPDGYHEIVTVMQTVRFFDYMTIEESDRFELFVNNQPGIDIEDNLIVKAYELFRKLTGINPGLKVTLKKNIPVGAGLGGGSSDAASMLKALNRIFGEPLSAEELLKESRTLGCDVPFFIKGGLAIAYGRGEKLRFFKGKPFKVLIAMPGIFCSTRDVYENLHVKSDVSPSDAERLIIEPIINEDWKELRNNLHNDLELSNAPCMYEVRKVKEKLEASGSRFLMTGSGSSLFSLDTNNIPLKIPGVRFKLVSTL